MGMVRTIRKIGNSKGLMFDNALAEHTCLRAGDLVNLTLHSNGVIVLTPLNPRITAQRNSAQSPGKNKPRL